MERLRRHAALALFSAVAAAGLVAAAATGLQIFTSIRAARQEIIRVQEAETARAAAQITAALSAVEAAAEDLATELARLPPGEEAVLDALRRTLIRHPDVASLTAAFAPFALDPERRLAAPVARRGPDGVEIERVERAVDYMEGSSGWYDRARDEGRHWAPPRFEESTGQWVIDFALAATHGAHGARLVVRASFLLDRLRDIVTLLELGHHGYGFLLDADGRPLVPPAIIMGEARTTTLHDAAWAARELGGSRTVPGRADGSAARLRVAEIAPMGWLLATVYDLGDAPVDFDHMRRAVARLTAFALLFLAGLGALHLMLRQGRDKPVLSAAWGWSVLVAITFSLSIGVIWRTVLHAPPAVTAHGDPVTYRSALDHFQRRMIRDALSARRDLPVFLPTGLFVQSVEFVSANNVKLTGYVWQRITPALAHVTPGVILPEAESIEIEEAYRRPEGQGEIIGWRFAATIRQSFDVSRFPLDREAIWLRLWPQDFAGNVVLVPDLDSYVTASPSARAGLERAAFIAGWHAVSTFFEYRPHGYGVGFGLRPAQSELQRPELHFNIEIRRNFLDPLVSHITPVALVLLLIFAMQMTVTRENQQKDLFGFNAATIITTCAALFFAVLISHIEARGALAAKAIFYGEYFYLVTYAVILFTCVNAILFTQARPPRLIDYRDNLLPKILYWPVVMGALYGITLAVFY
ncbi:MAG TPA: hypothetical protein VIK87_03435 [Sphingomonadales bacterium]